MAAQTWASLQTTLLAATVKAQPPYSSPPPDFAALFPQATSYAEERICNDIPFLGYTASNSSLTTTAGSRDVDLNTMTPGDGQGQIIIPESFFLITPAGATPSAGTRVPFVRSSKAIIDQVWPVPSVTQTPSLITSLNIPYYWTLRDDRHIIYAPTADASYTVDITGLFQPPPISSANQSTYLSTNYPALLEAACMVWLEGALLHNFSAMSDDPKASVSWEMTYQVLMEAARDEEVRRRGLKPNAPTARSQAPA